jgi:hypothetical protein
MRLSDERSKLEDLLNEVPDKINASVPVPGNIPEELQSAPMMGINFADLRTQCSAESRVMIINAISFILPQDMIDGNEYIKNKLDVDVMSLSGIVYQLRVNEAAQKLMLEEMDRGFIHPRMFEVFGQLSGKMGDLNKQLLQTVEAIKSTYKDIKNDEKEKRQDALSAKPETLSLPQGDGSMVTMGTKELIQKMKDKTRLANIQKVIDDVTEDVVPIE